MVFGIKIWEVKSENQVLGGAQVVSLSISEPVVELFSFRKVSENCQIVPKTLSIWFTEKASSERNRESSFHIIVILSVIWVCKCWSQPVRPEVDNYPRQSSQRSSTQMLPEPDSKWMKLSRCLAHIARLVGASCDYQRKSQFSLGWWTKF